MTENLEKFTAAEIDEFSSYVAKSLLCMGLHSGVGKELFRRLCEQAKLSSPEEETNGG